MSYDQAISQVMSKNPGMSYAAAQHYVINVLGLGQ